MDPIELSICVEPGCKLSPLLFKTGKKSKAQQHLDGNHCIQTIQDIKSNLFSRKPLRLESKINAARQIMSDAYLKVKESLNSLPAQLQGIEEMFDKLNPQLEVTQSRQFLIKLYCYVFDTYPKHIRNELTLLLNETQQNNQDASFLVLDGLFISKKYLRIFKSLLISYRAQQQKKTNFIYPRMFVAEYIKIEQQFQEKQEQKTSFQIGSFSKPSLNTLRCFHNLQKVNVIYDADTTTTKVLLNKNLPNQINQNTGFIQKFQDSDSDGDVDPESYTIDEVKKMLANKVELDYISVIDVVSQYKMIESLTIIKIQCHSHKPYQKCPINDREASQLKKLKLYFSEVSYCWIHYLRYLEQLEELWIQYPFDSFKHENNFLNDFLQINSKLKLRKLTFFNVPGFRNFFELPNLTFPFLKELTVNTQSQSILQVKLPVIEKLWLISEECNQKMFDYIETLTTLKSLNLLVYKPVTNTQINQLKNLPLLERFVFQSFQQDQTVINLNGFKSLTQISLSVYFMPKVDFSSFEGLVDLRLDIKGRCSGNLEMLEKNLNLVKLRLVVASFEEDVRFPNIEILKKLRNFYFHTYDNYHFRNQQKFDQQNLFLKDSNYSINMDYFRPLTILDSIKKITLKFAKDIDVQKIEFLTNLQRCQVRIDSPNFKINKQKSWIQPQEQIFQDQYLTQTQP